MDRRRDLLERLDAAGIAYFVTGSEAMGSLGLDYRATNDVPLLAEALRRAGR